MITIFCSSEFRKSSITFPLKFNLSSVSLRVWLDLLSHTTSKFAEGLSLISYEFPVLVKLYHNTLVWNFFFNWNLNVSLFSFFKKIFIFVFFIIITHMWCFCSIRNNYVAQNPVKVYIPQCLFFRFLSAAFLGSVFYFSLLFFQRFRLQFLGQFLVPTTKALHLFFSEIFPVDFDKGILLQS